MAVVTVVTLTVKPDRFEDELDDLRKSKALAEKNGSKNVRVLAAMVAGEQTGTLAFISEADDFASSGAALDKFLTDPEGQAMMAAANTGASPLAAGFQLTTWVDVPL